MKNRTFSIVIGLALILGMGNAMSQETDSNDEDEMDATMRLMSKAEAELPDAVTKPITLPDAVLMHNSESPAIAASHHGMTTATTNKKLRGEDGLTKADEARNRASEMSDQAQNNRETRGRSEDRPEPPPRPEIPGPPAGPPGQN